MRSRPNPTIEVKAHKLLEDHNCLRRPVPLDVLAHRLGLRVQPAILSDDISGVLVLDGNMGTIGVNSSHAPVRQRFTIAHEIGHYELHRTSSRLFIDKAYPAFLRSEASSSGEDRQEVQANQFAAALLMPADLVRAEARKSGFDLADESSLAGLADAFQVSRQAMSFRLANLGLL
jgi:Zn-dependent peptidase ImmA (M78 family)